MKKFLVVLLACAMIFGFASTALAEDVKVVEFNDIAEQSQAVQNAVMKMAVLGVVEGNEGLGGAFRPAENVTRAEFAKIVCYLTGNVKNAEALATVGSRFSDVSTGNWYTGWVNMAAQSGYFFGDPDGRFRPNANITMQEVVTVALRAAGYNDKLGSSTGNSVWPGNYNVKAQNIGLLDDVTFVGSAPATRADMAVICEAVLGINMVVHINNDIAYALALSDGTVDPDGYSEVYYISNETNRNKVYETILHKAFKGVYYDVQVQPAYMSTKLKERVASTPADEKMAVDKNEINFDETSGWKYEDFSSGELALNVAYDGSYVYADNKKFEDVLTYSDSDSKSVKSEYGGAEALASKYYITRGFDLTDLAAMQVQITVIDGKEIAFVDVVSSKLDAAVIYRSNNNINVDGKDYRPSNTMQVNNSLTKVADYTKDFCFLEEGDGVLNMVDSDSDDDFGGRLYLDKDGRVYGVKNYNAYDGVVFGIFEKIDSNVAEWKDQNSKAVGQPGGDAKFNKTETNKNYTLYRDGESVKFEDLEENDVVYFLNNNGAPFFWATSPVEGELTKQNNTTVTVGGKGYNVDTDPYNAGMLFHLSDDGGDTFMKFDISMPSNNIESFGEAEYAMAYNFNKLAYVNSNLTNTKIIGVVDTIKPTQGFSTGSGVRNERYEEITIVNMEGKTQTYKFTSDFRDGYTWFVADTGKYSTTNWNLSSSGASKWASAYDASKSVENLNTLKVPLKAGDIVQLVVNKDDAVKKLVNYASFNVSGSARAQVISNKDRLTVSNLSGSQSTGGSYTLSSDAVVFEVSTDSSNGYDDTSIISVSSILSSDFDASKIVAFDIKSNSNVSALYLIRSVSVAKYGIVTQVAYDNDGWILTINGTEVRADDPVTLSGRNFKSRQRAVVAYNMVAGEAKLVRFIAAKEALELPLISTKIDGTVNDVFGVYGTVTGTNTSGNKSVTIKAADTGKEVIIYSADAYIYDFTDNSAVTNVNDLRTKFVVAYYDKNYEASCIAILSASAFDPTPAGKSADASIVSVLEKNVSPDYDDDMGLNVAKITIPYAAAPTVGRNDIEVAEDATFKLYSDVFTTEVTGTTPIPLIPAATTTIYVEVTAENGTTIRYAIEIKVEALAAPKLDTVTIDGNVVEGETLAAVVKDQFDATITTDVTYKWQREGNPHTTISTSATYVPVAADVGKRIRVIVTGTPAGAYDGQEKTSAWTTAVEAAPAPAPTYAVTIVATAVPTNATEGTWTAATLAIKYSAVSAADAKTGAAFTSGTVLADGTYYFYITQTLAGDTSDPTLNGAWEAAVQCTVSGGVQTVTVTASDWDQI